MSAANTSAGKATPHDAAVARIAIHLVRISEDVEIGKNSTPP